MSMKSKTLFFSIFLLLSFSAAAYYPGDEQPTSYDVWAKITYANFEMDSIDDIVKIVVEARGEASPNTHHCGIIFIVVYKNGSSSYDGTFIEGPINVTGEESLIFMPLGENWTNWRFYNVVYVNKEELGFSIEDLENVSSFEVWVRAYKDAESKLWNQSFLTVTQNVSSEIEEFYEEGDNNQNIWLLIILISTPIAAGYAIYRWRKRR